MRLFEVMVSANEHLTQDQSTTLLKIYQAQQVSPDTAADVLKGDVKAMASGEFLIQQRMVVLTNTGIQVTQYGITQLTNLGLLDANGVTQAGAVLVNAK